MLSHLLRVSDVLNTWVFWKPCMNFGAVVCLEMELCIKVFLISFCIHYVRRRYVIRAFEDKTISWDCLLNMTVAWKGYCFWPSKFESAELLLYSSFSNFLHSGRELCLLENEIFESLFLYLSHLKVLAAVWDFLLYRLFFLKLTLNFHAIV